ncbi:hypothetical protein TrLO_g11575 [Triparma laevis f. longispina]|uniref:Tic20 family protein Ycf60 n=1 Tax=Triparma laevis f. longispina TaxID=1714387 RepID=A0A9W7CGG7_9STRA|nr:hypothetical protein TrLO_g11575 [Triparma laevis f. longispina]
MTFDPDSESAPLSDRFLSLLPYVLPLADGAEFGKYIYMRFPPVGVIERATILPITNIFNSVPFSSLIIFIGLSFLARSQSLTRYIRFNIQQAILIDITLIFPALFGGAADNLPRAIVEPSTNFIFYVFAATMGYCFFYNLVEGKEPREIPIVSQAAEQQIGPF